MVLLVEKAEQQCFRIGQVFFRLNKVKGKEQSIYENTDVMFSDCRRTFTNTRLSNFWCVVQTMADAFSYLLFGGAIVINNERIEIRLRYSNALALKKVYIYLMK